jgi:hypothetical protein
MARWFVPIFLYLALVPLATFALDDFGQRAAGQARIGSAPIVVYLRT